MKPVKVAIALDKFSSAFFIRKFFNLCNTFHQNHRLHYILSVKFPNLSIELSDKLLVLLPDLKSDKNSFAKLGVSAEEKVFCDISDFRVYKVLYHILTYEFG